MPLFRMLLPHLALIWAVPVFLALFGTAVHAEFISFFSGESPAIGAQKGPSMSEYAAAVETIVVDPETNETWIGGYFSSFAGVPSQGAIILRPNSGTLRVQRPFALHPLINGVQSFNDRVRAIALNGSRAIFGGSFSVAGGLAASFIVGFDRETLTFQLFQSQGFKPPTAFDGPGVYALAMNGSRELYIGGNVQETLGGLAFNYIVRYCDGAFSPLSSGGVVGVSSVSPTADPIVFALLMQGRSLVVGGLFDRAGNTTVNNLAIWDGSTFLPLVAPGGIGVDDFVRVMVLEPSTGDLIIGGAFYRAGGRPCNGIARWSSLAKDFFPLLQVGTTEPGFGFGIVRALTFMPNGVLAIGGYFKAAGSSSGLNSLATWNGTHFAPFRASDGSLGLWSGGAGPSTINALAVAQPSGLLLVAADSTAVLGDGGEINSMCRWNGTDFSRFVGQFDRPGVNGPVRALSVSYPSSSPATLWMAGDFTKIGGFDANRWAGFNENQAIVIRGTLGVGVDGDTYALATSPLREEITIGGRFTEVVGQVPVSNIVTFDRTSGLLRQYFSSRSPMGTVILALAYNGSSIAVGGDIPSANGVRVNHITVYNPSTLSFSPLAGPNGAPPGVDGIVRAVAFLPNGDLLLAGDFMYAGGPAGTGTLCARVCVWNGFAFSPLPFASLPGVDSIVYSVAVNHTVGQAPSIWLGGVFANAGLKSANRIVMHDGQRYVPLQADGCFYDGISPNTLNGVFAIAVFGDSVYAGGDFLDAGCVVVNRITRFDGSRFHPLITNDAVGVDGTVSALTVFKGMIALGGSFDLAGDQYSFGVAVWRQPPTPSPSPSLSPSASSSPGATVSASSSASESASASASASDTCTPSLTISPSSTPTVSSSSTASPSISESPSLSASATESESSSATASISRSGTPAPSTPVKISLRFEGGVHQAPFASTASPSGSVSQPPSGSVDDPPPVTIVSKSWIAPKLRVSITKGCVGVDAAVVFRCTPILFASAKAPASPLDANRRSSPAGSALTLQPPFIQLKPAQGGCASFPGGMASFTLSDGRSWPSARGGHSAAANNAPAAGCFGDGVEGPQDRYGYYHAPLLIVKLQCELLALPLPSATVVTAALLADSRLVEQAPVLSRAHAAALIINAPLLLPLDIMVLRPPTASMAGDVIGILQSMRFGTSKSVALLPGADQLGEAGAAAVAVLQRFPSSNFTSAIKSRSIAASAEALFAAGSSAGLTSASGLSSFALSGSTTLVILLDQRSSAFYPDPSALLGQYQRELDATAEAEALPASNLPGGVREGALSLLRSSVACSTPSVAAELSNLRSNVASTLTPSVLVGSFRAQIKWTAFDGSQLHVSTPSFAELCPSSSGDCGYQAISMQYQWQAASSRGLTASSSAWAWLGEWLRTGPSALISSDPLALTQMLQSLSTSYESPSAPNPRAQCPPWCPSLMPDDTMPLAVSSAETVTPGFDSWQGNLVPALPELLPDNSTVPAAPVASAVSSSSSVSFGLYYTPQCVGFTPIESGACTNSSHPAFDNCAFGSGDSCTPCFRAEGRPIAVCPGGRRALPLPGFFTSSETSGVIEPCPPPSSRCLGWNASISAVQCAEGYKTPSYLCTSCSQDWYPKDDGTCSRCASSSSIGALAVAILSFVGAVLVAFVAVLAFTWLLAKAVGGRVSAGFLRIVDLLIWILLLLQVIASAGKVVASAGLPPVFSSLFAALAATQFEAITLPSACWDLYPFLSEMMQCGAVLTLSMAAAAFCSVNVPAKLSGWGPVMRILGRYGPVAVFSILSLLYSLVSSSTLRLLTCDSIAITPLALASLNSDASAEALLRLSRDPATAIVSSEVSVLRFNPGFVCWQGSHRPAGVVAIITLLVYLLGFPLVSFFWIRSRLREASDPKLMAAEEDALRTLEQREGLRATLLLFCCGRERCFGGAGLAAGNLKARSLDADKEGKLASDPRLHHFIDSGYRPSVFEMRHIDLACLFLLAALQLSKGTSVVAAAWRGAAIVAVLFATAGYSLTRRPFPEGQGWKLAIKAGSLLIAALAAVVTHLALAAALENRKPDGVFGLAVTIVVASILLFLVLAFGFGYSVIQGAKLDARYISSLAAQRRAQKRAPKLTRQSLKDETGNCYDDETRNQASLVVSNPLQLASPDARGHTAGNPVPQISAGVAPLPSRAAGGARSLRVKTALAPRPVTQADGAVEGTKEVELVISPGLQS